MRAPALAAAIAAAVITLLPAVAAGHAGLTPGGLEAGVETRFSLEIPNEREGRVTTSLDVSVPRGISIVRVEPVSGWSATTTGQTISWTGGRIEGESVASFFVTAVANVPPGSYALSLEQGYDDGKSVDTETAFTVLPAAAPIPGAPEQHLGRALVAAIVGVLAVGTVLLTLRARRRGRRQA